VVAVSRAAYPVAEALVTACRRAGVPRSCLQLAPAGASLIALGEGPIHFAAVDLGLEQTRRLYASMSVVREGQAYLKALISIAEGPRPGEPGFLRLFAHPKTVAVRTFRHGADLQ